MIHAFAIVRLGLVAVTGLAIRDLAVFGFWIRRRAQFALSLTLIESILFYSVIRAIAIIICKGMMMMVILTLGMVYKYLLRSCLCVFDCCVQNHSVSCPSVYACKFDCLCLVHSSAVDNLM